MAWWAVSDMIRLLVDLLEVSGVILAGVAILGGSLAIAASIADDAAAAWRKARVLAKRIREDDGGLG
ncbi:hypothetical protein D3C78_1783450 [compost metagenome]